MGYRDKDQVVDVGAGYRERGVRARCSGRIQEVELGMRCMNGVLGRIQGTGCMDGV